MKHAIVIGLLYSAAVPAVGHAGVLDVVNAQRLKQCGRIAAPRTPVRSVKELSAAAALLPRGMKPSQAALQSGYRGNEFSAIHLQNYTSDASIAAVLVDSYCDTVNNPAFKDLGLYRKGKETWILLAAPHPLPTAGESAKVREDVLSLVNRARAKPRRCGTKQFAAAGQLTYSELLQQAALVHSKDMSAHDLLTHNGSNGDQVSERVTHTGYQWITVGENVASGQNDADSVVSGWLASPGHCANIMNPKFVHMGVAYAINSTSTVGIYWTQVFAAPAPDAKKKR